MSWASLIVCLAVAPLALLLGYQMARVSYLVACLLLGGRICDRCGWPFRPGGRPRRYCRACVVRFAVERADDVLAGSPGTARGGTLRLVGLVTRKPDSGPQSLDTPGGAVCGLCGCGGLILTYGFLDGYGLGHYQICESCHGRQDFTADTED